MSNTTTVTLSTPPSVESPEQQQRLLDRADGKITPETPPAPADNGLILGKFKSPEDLAKAYSELEKQFHARNQKPADTPPANAETTPPSNEKTEESLEIKPDEVKEQVESKGLDFNKYNESFSKNGDLTAEEYAELEKAGFGKEMVTTYIAGLKATLEATRNEILSQTGGEDNYRAMVQWAKSNLSPTEIQAYNDALNTASRPLAVKGLYARFTEANGREGNLVAGRSAGGISGYTGRGEMKAAMADPRYLKDPDYTHEVERRVALTSL